MDNQTDKERKSMAFEISDLQKAQFRQEALRMYASLDTQEKIDRALKPLVNPSPLSRLWTWTRTRISSFVNMLKVTAMSVLLGRAATDKRLNEGNRNAEKQERIAEAKKEAKIQVLYEKKAAFEKGVPEPEKTHGDSGQTQHGPDTEKDSLSGQEKSMEKEIFNEQPQNGVKLMKPNETVLSLQIAQMTELYRKGLTEFLQRESGLSANSIQVTNAMTEKGKPCIQIAMELSSGITIQARIDEHGRYLGNAKEMTTEEKRLCGDIRKMLLYYTAKEYKPSKDKEIYDRTGYERDGRILRATEHNKNTLRPGTTLTRRDFMQAFQTANERGYVNCFDFGHVLNMKRENGKLTVSIDGNTVDLSHANNHKDGADILHEVYAARIKEDYAAIESGAYTLTQSIELYKNTYEQEHSPEQAEIPNETDQNAAQEQKNGPDPVRDEEPENQSILNDFQEVPDYVNYGFDDFPVITPLDENGRLEQSMPDQIEAGQDEQERQDQDQEQER